MWVHLNNEYIHSRLQMPIYSRVPGTFIPQFQKWKFIKLNIRLTSSQNQAQNNIVTAENSREESKISPHQPIACDVGEHDAQRHGKRRQGTQTTADLGVTAFAHLQF